MKYGIRIWSMKALAALMLTFGAAAPAAAAVPELIHFQGKLTDTAGKAAAGTVPMVFKLYTAASGGSPVWTETQSVTPDNFGIYGVMLGEVTPLNINFSTAYWLGVTVGTDGEMLPRYRVGSSAYSLYSVKSSTAVWAEGADWPTITNKPALTLQGNTFNGASQLVQVGADNKLPALDGSNLTGLPTAFLADGSVTTAKLAANAVTDAKVSLSTAAITSGKFGDARVAVSTQALSGGIYNAAGRLVQLGPDGSLPALNGANLTALTKAQVGLGSADNTADSAKPVSAAQQAALDLKADLAGAVFSGVIAASNLSGTNTGDETAATVKTKLGAATTLVDGYLTSADWTVFNGKLAPNGNGSSLTNLTKTQVGLGNVTNTSDAAKPVSTAQQAALDLKADLTGATFSGVIEGSNLSGTNTGDETAATMKTKLGAATTLADGYLTAADWTIFSGKLAPNGNGANLTGLTKTQVGLANVNNTSDAAKPVSAAQQTALDLKADLAGAAFSGAVSASNLSGANTGDETSVTIKAKLGAATTLADGYLTAADWTVFNAKLAANGNGSGLTGLTKTQVGLGNVTNTSDANKPVSTAQQAALDLKADLTGATFSGVIAASNLSGANTGDETAATVKAKLGAATALADGYLTSVDWSLFNAKLAANGNGSSLTGLTKTQVGLGSVTNDAQIPKTVGTAKGDMIAFSAAGTPASLPAGTDGTVLAADSAQALGVKWKVLAKGDVGLGSVDNTADTAKPVSVAQQAELDLKAPLVSPSFTGTVSGITSAMVGLGNVTDDAQLKAADLDVTAALGTSDTKVPSQKAVKTYVDTGLAAKEAADVTIVKEADLAAADFNTASGIVSLDYANGQAASAVNKGFLASADWSSFNAKASAAELAVKLSSGLASANIFVGNAQNQAAAVAMSGDAVISNAGAVTISGLPAARISGGTVDNTEFDYLNGLTGAIQTQLDVKASAALVAADTDTLKTQIDGKQATITGAASTITTADLTVNRALLSDASGKVAVSAVTNTELGYLSGVTGPIQAQLDGKPSAAVVAADTTTLKTQIDGKQATITGAASTITTADLTVNRALLSDASGKVAVSAVTNTELGYLSGVSGPVQAQLDGKAVLGATQTFTGENTFTSTVAAKGFASAAQAVSLSGSVATFAVDGSGVVMLTQSAGVNAIATITGCNSGDVGQGQMVVFVMAGHGTGTLTFLDTDVGSVDFDTLLLNGSSITWAPSADAASIGSTITLLCTTINSKKAWVEIGRSKANGVGT